MPPASTVNVYVFYFDLIGFVDSFLSEGQGALSRLRSFQQAARSAFTFSQPHSFIVTLYDNVWSRINVAQPGTPSLVLDFAGTVMGAAIQHGFPKFFGAVTRGIHDYEINDRMLIGKESFEDLSEQHLDITSEPHIRAVLAEKWSARSAGPQNAVWVSSEVMNGHSLSSLANLPDAGFTPVGDWFSLGKLDGKRSWPFPEGRFHAIAARGSSE